MKTKQNKNNEPTLSIEQIQPFISELEEIHKNDPFLPSRDRENRDMVRAVARDHGLGRFVIAMVGAINFSPGNDIETVWCEFESVDLSQNGRMILDVSWPLRDDAFKETLTFFVTGDRNVGKDDIDAVARIADFSDRVLLEVPAGVRYYGKEKWHSNRN